MDNVNARNQAALTLALGCARGALLDVLSGEFTPEQIKHIYNTTSATNIASSIAVAEQDLETDWAVHLTDQEQQKIKGHCP